MAAWDICLCDNQDISCMFSHYHSSSRSKLVSKYLLSLERKKQINVVDKNGRYSVLKAPTVIRREHATEQAPMTREINRLPAKCDSAGASSPPGIAI